MAFSADPRRLDIVPFFPAAPKVGTAPEGREGWKLCREWGGYPELEWTFGIFRERILAFGGTLPAYFYEELSDFDTARTLLRYSSHLQMKRSRAFPSIGLSFRYFDSAYRTTTGRLTDDGAFRGRHAVTTVDHEDLAEIKFRNTWNPPYWGDKGFGYVTRDYFDHYVESVHVRWCASGGPCIAHKRCMETARTRRLPEEERMIDCWARARNVFWQQMVGDEEHPFTMLNWQVYSVADGSLVDVIEMRDQDEIVGRTHLYYDEENASIRELFVRPTRRREYIGSILEGTAAEWARNLGAKTLRNHPKTLRGRAGVM
jgi:GNAT superfamily N-acetyltransferase